MSCTLAHDTRISNHFLRNFRDDFSKVVHICGKRVVAANLTRAANLAAKLMMAE